MDTTELQSARTVASLTPLRRYRSAALGLADQGIVSVANFLSIVLLARSLPLAAFGTFMVAHTVLVLLTSLQNSLIAQPHNILGAQRSGHDYFRLTAALGALQLFVSCALAVCVALAGFYWQSSGALEYSSVAFSLALVIPAWMGQEFVRRVLYTQGDLHAAAVNNLISYGLQLGGIVALLEFSNSLPTPSQALYIFGASSLIACLFGGLQLKSIRAQRPASTGLQPRLELKHAIHESWTLSRWLVAQQGVSWLGASGHGLLLTAIAGPAVFGLYRAAYQVVNVLNPLRQAATNHLPSKAARVFAVSGAHRLSSWSKRAALSLGIPFAACALVIVLAADPIARIMYDSRVVVPNLHWFVVLGALAYLLNFARTPLDYAVLVAGGGRALFRRTLWLNAFVLTAGLILIKRFGIQGALLSEVLTALIAALLTFRLFRSIDVTPRTVKGTTL